MADDDTTRVADEPPADYFRPLKKRATCNCGAKPGRPVAECAECAHKAAPSVEEPEGEANIVRVNKKAWANLNSQLTELRAENERLKSATGEKIPQAAVDTLLAARETITPVYDDAYWCIGKTAALLTNGLIEIRYTDKSGATPAPAPPAETGEAASGNPWSVVTVSMGDDTIPALKLRDRFVDRGMLQSAAAWLNRRAEIEAHLATYKQQAEAWRSEVKRLLGVGDEFVRSLKRRNREILTDACLHHCAEHSGFNHERKRLAAQLESQQPSDGKAEQKGNG